MYQAKSINSKNEVHLPNETPLGKPLSELWSTLEAYLEAEGYSEKTRRRYAHELSLMQQMMNENGIPFYTNNTGALFCQKRFQEVNSYSLRTTIKSIVFRLNCILEGRSIPKQVYSKIEATPEFQDILFEFIEYCKERGNAEKTLNLKEYYAKRFFINIKKIGCDNIGNLTPEIVIKASIAEQHKEGWQFIRRLLCFLFEFGYVKLDFGPLVPINRRRYSIPTSYTVQEIAKVEKAAGDKDKKPLCAERDLAITMLASRYGFRSGDIRRLTKENVDFENERISFIQHKSPEPVDYPLYPEVKNALLDYISNSRPESKRNEIFLCARVPHTQLSAEGIRCIIARAFKNSGVDISGKHFGPHALRSSNSSLKINGGMTYAETKQSIGWKDMSVMKRYVRIHVEKLRLCALEPVPAVEDSFFEKFLLGRASL